jgi:hypothetical protein
MAAGPAVPHARQHKGLEVYAEDSSRLVRRSLEAAFSIRTMAMAKEDWATFIGSLAGLIFSKLRPLQSVIATSHVDAVRRLPGQPPDDVIITCEMVH